MKSRQSSLAFDREQKRLVRRRKKKSHSRFFKSSTSCAGGGAQPKPIRKERVGSVRYKVSTITVNNLYLMATVNASRTHGITSGSTCDLIPFNNHSDLEVS